MDTTTEALTEATEAPLGTMKDVDVLHGLNGGIALANL
jgi:hypothetical protein